MEIYTIFIFIIRDMPSNIYEHTNVQKIIGVGVYLSRNIEFGLLRLDNENLVAGLSFPYTSKVVCILHPSFARS